MVRNGRAATTQQSSNTLPGSSQPEAPNPEEDDLELLTETQLDERIKALRADARLKRKRDYLTAIQRGEATNLNPFEFDDPENNDSLPSKRRPGNESFTKL